MRKEQMDKLKTITHPPEKAEGELIFAKRAAGDRIEIFSQSSFDGSSRGTFLGVLQLMSNNAWKYTPEKVSRHPRAGVEIFEIFVHVSKSH